ncbi:hypothetical protein AVEN_141379-1 [Araneus ventricosus]|uniref:Uncharacterized protein n=2 Tax=Araneus ventricosus TaxID=182803 RepID=A0A4Y2CY98_ARAVE|nr:hypothetical protein AVEN_141379-1 [Araneus ventricosus]
MLVSVDWFTDGTNASTTIVIMWKSNMYQHLSTFVYLFDFVNKPYISEDLLPYFLNHLPRKAEVLKASLLLSPGHAQWSQPFLHWIDGERKSSLWRILCQLRKKRGLFQSEIKTFLFFSSLRRTKDGKEGWGRRQPLFYSSGTGLEERGVSLLRGPPRQLSGAD